MAEPLVVSHTSTLDMEVYTYLGKKKDAPPPRVIGIELKPPNLSASEEVEERVDSAAIALKLRTQCAPNNLRNGSSIGNPPRTTHG